ncbi:hypothetical protein NEUTE2DRAFT_158384 [Neurospora tetrasperma FGSC 2509]|nr:hypothetical protein NEUTE2DRAFT_158384 [Neurospora tetrasperma FGSC 2509]
MLLMGIKYAIDLGTGSGLLAIDRWIFRRVCKPGGWIEHVDITATVGCDDGTAVTGSALEQYGRLSGEAGKRLGLTQSVSGNNFSSGKRLGKGCVCALEGTGIQDPKQKDVGLYAYAEVSSDIQGIILFTFG